jgi:TPP-dependent pyruvate/acetoin dehydrogenase alpha subunit
MAEMYGKYEGCSHGRGGSMHLFDAKSRFFGGSAIVGGALPLATGCALADKMRGRNAITACFFGEGAVAEGVFHESLNLASLWKAPVLFLCENNLYAMGTAIERSEADTDLCEKAASYRIAASAVDGMDVIAVREATAEAAARVRAGEGPRFLEFRTYRFRAHSMFDAELYRKKAEVESWKQRCPVKLYTERLMREGTLGSADMKRIESEVEAEIAAAVAYAEAGTWERVDDLTRDVYTRKAA